MRTFLPRIPARLQVSLISSNYWKLSGCVPAFRTPEQNLPLETIAEFR
jgi:hypothetical protein